MNFSLDCFGFTNSFLFQTFLFHHFVHVFVVTIIQTLLFFELVFSKRTKTKTDSHIDLIKITNIFVKVIHLINIEFINIVKTNPVVFYAKSKRHQILCQWFFTLTVVFPTYLAYVGQACSSIPATHKVNNSIIHVLTLILEITFVHAHIFALNTFFAFLFWFLFWEQFGSMKFQLIVTVSIPTRITIIASSSLFPPITQFNFSWVV